MQSMAYVYEFLWATLYLEDDAADAENEMGALEEISIPTVTKEGKLSTLLHGAPFICAHFASISLEIETSAPCTGSWRL